MPTHHLVRKSVLLATLLSLAVPLSRGANLPDLVQLKMAAEGGAAVAQYEYGQRIYNAEEKADWYLRSAQQGYAPAQDTLAGIYAGRYIPDPRKKRAMDRAAVRWASRAAYQGNTSAQSKLSSYYHSGKGVSKDPVAAYMWAQIAVDMKGGDHGLLGGIVEKANRDGLVKTTTTENILEGLRRAAAFKTTRFKGLNPVEADLVFSELELSAIYIIKEHQSAVVNSTRFGITETKELRLDDQSVLLTCLAIEGKSARFAITGTDYQTTLHLKR